MVKGKVRHFSKAYWDELDGIKHGRFTVPMVLTMLFLHRYADFQTGEVKYTSGATLETLSGGEYSARTFSRALNRLEQMGYITRHNVLGSNEPFPVTIHNFERVETDKDGNDFMTILNPKKVKTWQEIKAERVRDGGHDGGHDDGDEDGDDVSMKDGGIAPTNEGTSAQEPEGVVRDVVHDVVHDVDHDGGGEVATYQDRERDGTSRKTTEKESESGDNKQQPNPVAVAVTVAQATPTNKNIETESEMIHRIMMTQYNYPWEKEIKPEPEWVEINGIRMAPGSLGTKHTQKSKWTYPLILARLYHDYLGAPVKWNYNSWEKEFSELLLTYPNLSELLFYTFELDPKGKWADQLKGIPKPVNSPVGYLKFLLPKIQCDYLDYLETLEHQDGVQTLIAEGKTYTRAGEQYRFVNTVNHGPCWCRVGPQGEFYKVGWETLLNLDLPMPEDLSEGLDFNISEDLAAAAA